MKNHSQIIIFLLGITISTISTSSRAQNLISNPNFDFDVSAWSIITPGTFTQNGTLDTDNNLLSGSGEIANLSPAPFGSSAAFQCLEGIIAGSNYDFGAMIRFDSNNSQTASGRANIVLNFYDSPSCSGTYISGFTTANYLSENTNSWTQNEILNSTAPAGSVSVVLRLFTVKTEDTGIMTVNFDNVVFGPSGVLPVELMNFTVD